MLTNVLNWLGNARAENDAINTLTDQLAHAKGQAEMYRKSADLWKRTARAIQDDLDAARPDIEYAARQRANRARYDAKRRGK